MKYTFLLVLTVLNTQIDMKKAIKGFPVLDAHVRKILLSLLLVMCGNVQASVCPQELMKDKFLREAFSFLRPLEGEHQLGSCHVELRVCEEVTPVPEDNLNHLVAELLVTDKTGRERYIPFTLNEFRNRREKQIVAHGARVFAFRFRDWNQDPATGSFERWDVEIFKKQDLSLDSLEVGYNSETELNSESPKFWISCGTELEAYIRKHPIRYRVRSWWWWITHPGSW